MSAQKQSDLQGSGLENPKQKRWLRVEKITGWAMLAAAFGVLLEVVIPRPPGEGTIGLIPLYIGFPIGAVGLVLVMWKRTGWFPAVMAAVGLVGILYFMGVYPLGVRGWIGGFFLGAASLYLPLPYRYATLVWAAVSFFGYPELNARTWGKLFDEFTLFGVGAAISGAYILWGEKKDG